MLVYRIALVAVIAATCLLATGGNLFAITFTSANLDDAGTWNTVYVQGFRPSLNASPNPGLSAGDPVSLEQFDFLKSGFSDSAANIQLAIVNTMWYDYTTQLTTSSSEFVGISSNTIASTAGIATGDPISFAFGSLPLTYGSEYAAVFVNDDGFGNLTPVLVSAMTENYIESPPSSGTFIPTTNYGTDSEFQYATSNSISGGFFSTFTFAGDAGFEATFSAVPEPSAAFLLVVAISAIMLSDRRMPTE